jgi:flagellar protein FlaF
MGSATVIATAFALILLIITSYFLVTAVLTTTEIVSYAQQESLNQQEQRVRTSISISNTSLDFSSSILYTEIINDGNVAISEFKYWDVYTGNITGDFPLHYQMGNITGKWNIVSIEPDIINPQLWDPQEVINISVKYPGFYPLWVKVTTANGVSASAYT